MQCKDLISDVIPCLKLSDTGILALNWMEEFKITHLPIIDDNLDFLGLISESDILDKNITDEQIGKHKLSLIRPYVYEQLHVFEAIKQIANFKITVVPVLTAENKYSGVISFQTILEHISQLAAIHEPGGIIILEMNVNDYSLSQIAQIIEGNDAKVLSCYITSPADSTKIDVTIKVNREDLSGILQTFQRYNYNVIASYHLSGYQNDIKNRFDEFMNYINL